MEEEITYFGPIIPRTNRTGGEHKSFYTTFTERNIGYVSIEEQNKIRNTHIAVLGIGGIGGPMAHILVHAGVEKLTLLDNDLVELSNLNRQPYKVADCGQYKIDVMERNLKGINPHIKIKTFHAVSPAVIDKILSDVDIAVLSLDGPAASIHIARECRKRGIPMIEAWATPLVFTRWFTNDSMDYESCYGLDTHDLDIEEIYENGEIKKKIHDAMISALLEIPHIVSDVSHDKKAFKLMMEGKIPIRSFAPIVWMVSSYTALDIIYSGILMRKKPVLSPEIIGFDPIRMEMRKFTPKKIKAKKSMDEKKR